MGSVVRIVTAGLLLFALTTNSPAQVSATIGGTVSDATGALIPGVEVIATNVNTGISTTQLTNEAGSYQIPSLQSGTYRLRASLAGFQTATRENIQLSQGQQVRFNFMLQVGTVATAVEVLADSATALATTTASVGDVLPDTEVRSLPLGGRDPLAAAYCRRGRSYGRHPDREPEPVQHAVRLSAQQQQQSVLLSDAGKQLGRHRPDRPAGFSRRVLWRNPAQPDVFHGVVDLHDFTDRCE